MAIPNPYAAHNGTAFSCDYLSSRPRPWISHSSLAGILQGSPLPSNICKSNVMLLAITMWLSKILHGEYRTHQHPAVAPCIGEVLPLSCMGLAGLPDGALLARNRMTSDQCWWWVIAHNFGIRKPTCSTVTLICAHCTGLWLEYSIMMSLTISTVHWNHGPHPHYHHHCPHPHFTHRELSSVEAHGFSYQPVCVVRSHRFGIWWDIQTSNWANWTASCFLYA